MDRLWSFVSPVGARVNDDNKLFENNFILPPGVVFNVEFVFPRENVVQQALKEAKRELNSGIIMN